MQQTLDACPKFKNQVVATQQQWPSRGSPALIDNVSYLRRGADGLAQPCQNT
jgi:hypothetical protein